MLSRSDLRYIDLDFAQKNFAIRYFLPFEASTNKKSIKWEKDPFITAVMSRLKKLKKRPTNVKEIVILNTAAFTSEHIPARINICKTPVLGEFFIRQFNGFAYPATFMAVTKKLPKEIKDGYLYPYDNYHNRIATAKFVQDIPMNEKHPSYKTLRDIEEALPNIILLCTWVI